MIVENSELIETLNSLGHKVVLINEEYFIFTEFVPAQELTPKHRLTGKKINGLVQNFGQLTTQFDGGAIKRIEQQIEGIKECRREYSSYFEWITFLP